ncbi:MAG TPA: hypothetical protein VGO62_11325 [Myxococcota bacterium]|jgi:hypothetical protein
MKNVLLALALTALALPSFAGAARAAEGNKASKDDYELDVGGTDSKLKAGTDGKFDLVIRPKNGMKIHPQAPLEVTFKDLKGVKPGKSKLGRNDLVDKDSKAPEVRTTLRADKPGQYTLDANVSFFLCTDAWCQRMSDHVSIAITVE